MNAKQNLGFMVVGGIIGVMGLLIGMSVWPLSASKGEFGDIECTSLTVVNGKGEEAVKLDATELYSEIRINGKHGEESFDEMLGYLSRQFPDR